MKVQLKTMEIKSLLQRRRKQTFLKEISVNAKTDFCLIYYATHRFIIQK